MKRSDLSFDVLQEEMDILGDEHLEKILGGNDGVTLPGAELQVTDYLSSVFGTTVTSSQDLLGNWMISIGGAAPIPLTFRLNEVVITATGQVRDKSTGGILEDDFGDWLTVKLPNTGGGADGGGGGGTIGGGDSSPAATLIQGASLAVYNSLAMNAFYTTMDSARLGILPMDASSIIHNIIDTNLPQTIINDIKAIGKLDGIALLSTTGKMLGVLSAGLSINTLYDDMTDGDGHVSMLNVADVAINVGSLFLKSNLVGATVSMGWLLIRGEFEEQ